MVVIAEAFLQHHEKNAINIATTSIPAVAPKSFYRYVDDSHARFNNMHEASEFKNILNQQNPQIKYTIETENEHKQLNFLDISITNKGGNYEFNVHRKHAITNVRIKPNSNHDPKILDGIFIGFIDRAHALCDEKHLDEEINFLMDIFVENGYNRKKLECCGG